jgi:hypothetical protein
MFRSLDDLRRAVANNEELSALDDEDLVRAYARDAEVPLDTALGYFGVSPEGTFAHWGRSLRGGGNDVKRMVGKGLQYYDKLTNSETFRQGSSQLGTDIEADADKNAFLSETDDRQVGGATKFIGTGLRAVVPALPAVAAAFASAPVSVPAAVGTGLMYGSSAAEDAYRNVYEATGDEDAAFAAGNRAGAVHGVGETAASLIGGKLISTGRAALGRSAKTTADVAERLTTKPGMRELGKAYVANAASQVGTEVAQDVGTNEIVRAYGGTPDDNWKLAGDSAYGALAMSVVLGPLVGVGHVRSRRQAAQIDHMLFGDHNNEELRTKAIDLVMAEAKRQNVDPVDIDSWYAAQRQAIDEDIAEREAEAATAQQAIDDETAAAQQARVDEAIEANRAPGEVRPLGEVVDAGAGVTAERYAGPDYAQQFNEAYTNPEPNEVVDADGNLVQETPAPQGIDALARAGYTPAQIDEILAERARTVAPPPSQQMEIDLLGGQAIDAPPSARGLQRPEPAAEQAAPTPYNPAQQVMPLAPGAMAPAPGPTLALPAPSEVMVAGQGDTATAQPVRMSDLIRQRLEQRDADRTRLPEQGDTVIPAGTAPINVDPASMTQINAPAAPAPLATRTSDKSNTTTYSAVVEGKAAEVTVTRKADTGAVTQITVKPEGGKARKITKLGKARTDVNDARVIEAAIPGAKLARAAPTNAAAPANPTGLSPAAADSRTDGTDDVVGESGLSIVHGSGRADLTPDAIQIVRTEGQKQGKKGRTYGGFYGTSQEDAAQAEGYAGMMGGTPTTYDVKIKPGTKVLNKTGDVTRLSAAYINELVSQGYGMVVGKDVRGRTEYVVIDKEAIAGMAARQTDASQTTEPSAKKTRAATIKEKVAKTGSAKTTAEEREAAKGVPLKPKTVTPKSLDAGKRKITIDPPKAEQSRKDTPAKKDEPAPAPKSENPAPAPKSENPAPAPKSERPTTGSDTLQGEVEGPESTSATGRVTIPQQTIAAIKDALLGRTDGSKLDPKSKRILKALKAVTTASERLSSASNNWFRSDSFKDEGVTKTGRDTGPVTRNYPQTDLSDNAAARVEDRFAGTGVRGKPESSLKAASEQLHAAVQELRAEVGNDRDIEALVAAVKKDAQAQLAALPQAQQSAIEATEFDPELQDAHDDAAQEAAEARKTDVALSSTWAAAKRGVFDGDTMDLADVNPGVTRDSKEKGTAGPQPLERAAATGIRVGNTTVTGLRGVLAYMRAHGTPMERMIARALFRAVDADGRDLALRFVDGKSEYDPASHTITLNRNASPEVALHETLHAALQWYIYTNPKSAALTRLRASLNRVLAAKNLTGKAADVQRILKDLVGQNKEADALLELVSYGTTLNEFRKALAEMKSEEAPAGFFASAHAIWRGIVHATQRLLGTSQNEASAVLAASMKLLEEATTSSAAQRNYTAGKRGSKLQADVQGGKPAVRTFRTRPATTYAGGAPVNPTGLTATTRSPHNGVSDQDFRTFARGPGRFRGPMQFAFEALGLGAQGANTARVTEAASKAAAYIRKNVPIAEKALLAINSKFSNTIGANAAIDRFKFDRNTGYMQMERVAAYLDANPDVAKPFLAFMDGDSKALDGRADGGKLRSAATSMRKLFAQYIDSLPSGSSERRHFTSNKFSDYLLFAGNVKQVAGTTFGVKKLGDMIGTERREEATLEGFVSAGWMRADADGVVNINDQMVQLFTKDAAGKLTHQGFMSKVLYDAKAPAGYVADPSRIWQVEEYKGKYRFVTSLTASQAIAKRETSKLTTALLNTTAALAHTYASRNFLSAMASSGRVDGKSTGASVAFDSVDQINELFPGLKYPLEDKNVLEASDDAADAAAVRRATQRTGTWVRMPGSQSNPGTYGALSGMIVPGPVWNAMLDMHDRSPVANIRAISSTVSFFKKSKTVFSPGTHMTNILTNFTMGYLHDIPRSTVVESAKLLAKYEINPASLKPEQMALMQAFLDSGAMLGEFTSSEVKQTIYDALIDNITPRSDDSMLSKLQSWSAYEKAKALGTKGAKLATDTYAAEDNAFRLAAFLKVAGDIQYRDQSKTLSDAQMQEAGLAARKMFLDYDIDARAIKALRQSVMPFISWSYAVTPVLARIAVTQPWKLANVIAGYAIIAGMMEDDDDEVRKAAPEYLRDRAFFGAGPYMHMRIPFMGDAETPVYFNAGKYVPMFSLLAPGAGATTLAGQEQLPGFMNLGGPIPGVIMALSEFDPFTGKTFKQPTDTQWDRLLNTSEAVWNLMAPTVASTKTWKEGIKIAAGENENPGATPATLFAARKFGGLGLYQYNVDTASEKQDKAAERVRGDFTTAMNKLKAEEMARGYPDYEELDEMLEEYRARMEERLEEVDPSGEEYEEYEE